MKPDRNNTKLDFMTTRNLIRTALILTTAALYLTACATEPRTNQFIAAEANSITAADISSGCAPAGTAKKTISLLLIGNSLMNDVQTKLEKLLTCGGYSSNIATSNPGGYRLEQHLTNNRTLELIARGYDLTLIQAHSNGIKDHSKPYKVLNSLKSKIESAGSTMGFYQTWAFQNRDIVITENILSRYELIAQDFNAPIIHIGRAWDYFYTSNDESPPFQLFKDYAHATEQGKSLIAYTLYAYLTGESPINLSGLSLDDQDASPIQTIAWATYKAHSETLF